MGIQERAPVELLLSNTTSLVTKINSKTRGITFFLNFSEPFSIPSLSEVFPGIERGSSIPKTHGVHRMDHSHSLHKSGQSDQATQVRRDSGGVAINREQVAAVQSPELLANPCLRCPGRSRDHCPCTEWAESNFQNLCFVLSWDDQCPIP